MKNLKVVLALMLLVVHGFSVDLHTSFLKQCLKCINNMETQYLKIANLEKKIDQENCPAKEHSIFSCPLQMPSYKTLLGFHWIHGKKELPKENEKEIQFSRVDGFARTGMFQLNKCIDVDENKLPQGRKCNRIANNAYIKFQEFAHELKEFKKFEMQKNEEFLSGLMKKMLEQTHLAMQELDRAKVECHHYLTYLEELIKKKNVFLF